MGTRRSLDWRVSRALMADMRRQRPDGAANSLSHSHGHALCLSAPASWRAGVDLERLRNRDVAALAAWVCSAQEQEALSELSGIRQQNYFYLLWTLKEALVKAAGLDFPAGMRAVGLTRQGELFGVSPHWHACSFQLEQDWMASMAWNAGKDLMMPHLRWHAGPGSALPAYEMVGIWKSAGEPAPS